MDFVYSVRGGEMFLSGCEKYCISLGRGYSGYREYRDDPAFETRKALGPIPRGRWVVHKTFDHPRLGPVAIRLEAVDVPDLAGRTGFYIHGDNGRGDFSASTGCIILSREARQCIDYLHRWAGIRTLIVE